MATDLAALIGSELADELADALGRIRHCVDQLSDEQVWWRSRDDMNSVANVLLHLAGNLRQWIICGVGGAADARDRPAEFAARGSLPKVELVRRLEATVAESCAVLRATSPAEWPRVRRVQEFDVTGLGAALGSVSHFRGHTQEIVYMTRTILGETYKFAWGARDPLSRATVREPPPAAAVCSGGGGIMVRLVGDQAALLRAVCAAPDDDLPRLVYADWLEENGRPERFIRLQCRIAELERAPIGSPWVLFELHEQAGRLLADHRPCWLGELPGWMREPVLRCPTRLAYRRGMVEEVGWEAGQLLSDGGALFDVAPVRRVRLTGMSKKHVRRLAAWPFLLRSDALDLSGEPVGDEGAAALAGSAGMCGIRELDLTGCGVTDSGAAALSRSGSLTALRVLRLTFGVRLTRVGVAALLTSGRLTTLERVCLSGGYVARDEQRYFAAAFGRRVWVEA